MQTHLALGDQFNNRGLFADHFLNDPQRHLLKVLPEWQQADGLDAACKAIEKLFRDKAARFTANTNEAQTEHDFIQPVLKALWGDECYQVQVSIPNLDARRQPDYAFFRTAKDRDAAEDRKGTIEYWRDVPVLGDAKKWSALLNKQRGADENPSGQIANYLYRSRVRWGILTNGRYWRLYEREKSSAGGVYYEVNVEDLLKRNDREAFKYFYLFFRRQAFLPDPTGRSFIDKVFQGSVDYATAVGDSLKESVYDALRLLMSGFFEHPGNELNRNDPGTVKLVHENCLIVLYRLLFLLFAEDKQLLPVDNPVYNDHSLKLRHQEINRRLREGRTYLPGEHRFWGELTGLFELIDNGLTHDGEVIIPAYNGGLFNPQRHPHIAHTEQPGVRRWQIGDHRLTEVIDMLAYQREVWNKPGTNDIDYNSLDIRHLGSIYEGLLELQPRVAPEVLIEAVEDGKPVFKPARAVPNPRPIRGQPPHEIQADEIYLVTNRGERKATGSYYTPQFIVSYIVEHTAGPLIEEAASQVLALRPQVDKEIANLEKTRREWEQKDDKKQVASFANQINDQKRRLLQPYLSLNILDSAMGSGHFLVGASDFLSLAMATDPNVLAPEDLGDEEPQAYYKRLVVEHCLYGVDLNPLAVELAKLSLWLHTASRNKALSFLDHHLRCGNSLIGARVEADLTKEPPRFNASGKRVNADSRHLVLGFTEALTAKHLSYFLDTFRKIVETPTGDAETERLKDKWYRDMDSVREQFRAVANCWLAPYFGVPVTPDQYQQAVTALRDGGRTFAKLQTETWFTAAQAVAQKKRFFHWELEFPEVFFDTHGLKAKAERGFNVTIGNPPYDADLDGHERKFIDDVVNVSGNGRLDTASLFVEHALQLVIPKRYIVYLLPQRLIGRQRDFGPFQKFIYETGGLKEVVYLGTVDEFASNDEFTILTFETCYAGDFTVAYDIPKEAFPAIEAFKKCIKRELWGAPDYAFNIYLNEFNQTVLQKVTRNSIRLGDIAESKDGIVVHLRDKLIAETKKDARYKKLLGISGRYFLDRYYVDWQPTYLCYDIEEAKKFIHDPVELRKVQLRDVRIFTKAEKLLTRQDSVTLRGTIDREKFFHTNSLHSTYLKNDSPYALAYVLCLINNPVLSYFYRTLNLKGQDLHPQVLVTNLPKLPIRRIEFETPTKERTQLLAKGKQCYERVLAKGDSRDVLQFVEQQLSAKPERADIIHDLLAYLAEQMIEMNKQKQTEVNGFLTWLERHVSAKIDDLSNKTRIMGYHENGLDGLLAVLQSNRRNLGEGVNPTARSFQEPVEKEFTASLDKLTPLKAKLTATDTLIDEIVYRLYGLTEKEIRIVKGESADAPTR